MIRFSVLSKLTLSSAPAGACGRSAPGWSGAVRLARPVHPVPLPPHIHRLPERQLQAVEVNLPAFGCYSQGTAAAVPGACRRGGCGSGGRVIPACFVHPYLFAIALKSRSIKRFRSLD